MKWICFLLMLCLVFPALAEEVFVPNSRNLPSELEQIPAAYLLPSDTPGTMARLDYNTWESFTY